MRLRKVEECPIVLVTAVSIGLPNTECSAGALESHLQIIVVGNDTRATKTIDYQHMPIRQRIRSYTKNGTVGILILERFRANGLLSVPDDGFRRRRCERRIVICRPNES